MNHRPGIAIAAAISLLAALLTAQDTPPAKPDLPAAAGTAGRAALGKVFSLSDGYGLRTRNGALVGYGPSFRADFDAEGLTFRAASRRPGGEGVQVRFRLLAVGRRSTDAVAVGTATVHDDGNRVRHVRPQVVEIHDVRADGVKQSFLFERLPPGTGDLVVRLGITTALPVAQAGDRAVTFEQPDAGGVRIGAVTGVDARGATVTGSLLLADSVLELSLPASFVDAATLPIVVDPLISSTVIVAPPGGLGLCGAEAHPKNFDVAYDPDSDLYAVVFDIIDYFRCPSELQLITAAGQRRGPSVTWLCESWYAHLGAVPGFRGFAVAVAGTQGCYADSDYATTIDENGSAAPVVSIYPTAMVDADMAGEAVAVDDDVLIVSQAVGQIMVTEYEPGSGTIVGRTNLTARGTPNGQVAISTTGGSTGRYLITWQRAVAGNATDIYGAIVDRDRNVLVPPFAIAATADAETMASVDGNGTDWVVAYQRAVVGSGDPDIYCRGVTYDERTGMAYLTPAAIPVEAAPRRQQIAPSVAWMGDSYLIGYTDQFSGADFDVWVRPLESFNCRRCQDRLPVARGPLAERNLRIASVRSAGGTRDEALLVWETASGTLDCRVYRADDGRITDLGGGCGQGGTASATCAATGSLAFGIGVRHAAPATASWLLVGLGQTAFPCGPCTLTVQPLVQLATITDAHGNAAVRTAIAPGPSLIGVQLTAQWITAAMTGPCSGQLNLSNGLLIEIQ